MMYDQVNNVRHLFENTKLDDTLNFLKTRKTLHQNLNIYQPKTITS